MKVRVMLVREGRKTNIEVTNPALAYLYLKPKARHLDREHFWRIDLDARNRIVGFEVVSIGTLTASLIHPRELFLGAILSKAASIIVAHNHPSGETTPSDEDKEVTKRLVKAGEILGIPVTDHIVLGDGKYFSFREAGQL